MSGVIRPCLCKSSYCEQCASGWGHNARLRIVEGVRHFQTYQPIMLTLTIDPSRFVGPEAATEFVHRGSRIAKTMHEMRKAGHIHGGRFVWVLEFTEKGWPHWHVAVDSSFVPHAELQAEWNSRGIGGTLGHVWCGKKRFGNRLHAALYMSKYLVKPPRNGWPEWLLKSRMVFRRYGVSKGLLPSGAAREIASEVLDKLLEFEEREGQKHWEELVAAAGLIGKTLEEKLDACGEKCAVFDGKRFAEKFAGVLQLPLKYICDLCGVDHQKRPIRITWRQVEWLFSEDFQRVVEMYDKEAGAYV